MPDASNAAPPISRMARIERTVIGIIGALGLAAAMLQIVGRYIGLTSDSGSAEEVVVYLLVWAAFIASGTLARENAHVRPDVVLRLLPPRLRWVLEIFNCVIASGLCLLLAWYGAQIALDAWSLDERSTSGLAFPMWIYDAFLPTSGVLMLVGFVIRASRLCRGGPAAAIADERQLH
jgi:C4-dicarboxylate transporter, DctQ subunit